MSLDWNLATRLLPWATVETLYMVALSTIFATLLGMPLGILLYFTDSGRLKEQRFIYRCLSAFVNVGRSFPFAILMVAVIPLTRWIVGTSLGSTASIVPLALAAAAMIARLTETALSEVPRGLVEAACVMGSTSDQILRKVLLPEALPSLILAITLTWINLIGYSAMAGLMGGGGLGQVAIQYGYQRFNSFLMTLTVLLLIVIVQISHWLGQRLAKHFFHKRGLL